jgi:hypothetical protein
MKTTKKFYFSFPVNNHGLKAALGNSALPGRGNPPKVSEVASLRLDGLPRSRRWARHNRRLKPVACCRGCSVKQAFGFHFSVLFIFTIPSAFRRHSCFPFGWTANR